MFSVGITAGSNKRLSFEVGAPKSGRSDWILFRAKYLFQHLSGDNHVDNVYMFLIIVDILLFKIFPNI